VYLLEGGDTKQKLWVEFSRESSNDRSACASCRVLPRFFIRRFVSQAEEEEHFIFGRQLWKFRFSHHPTRVHFGSLVKQKSWNQKRNIQQQQRWWFIRPAAGSDLYKFPSRKHSKAVWKKQKRRGENTKNFLCDFLTATILLCARHWEARRAKKSNKFWVRNGFFTNYSCPPPMVFLVADFLRLGQRFLADITQ
jgi:hypothetical protein